LARDKVDTLKPGEAIVDQRVYRLTTSGSPGVENPDWGQNLHTVFDA
jgi:hypothetical protein